MVLMTGSVLHPSTLPKHFMVFHRLLQIIYGVGGRKEASESVREGWCPAEKNFSVGVLTGWSKKLKITYWLEKQASFLTNGP